MSNLRTYRFFRAESTAYSALASYVDTSRGYPNDTIDRGLPLFDWLLHEEESGWGIKAIGSWRFTGEDDIVVAEAIAQGGVEELSEEEYNTIRNNILDPPEPEPEEEPPFSYPEPPPLPEPPPPLP